MVRSEERANATNKPSAICSSDPVEMVVHVLGETGSVFQAFLYDYASRNQDAFTMFDF